MMRAAARAKQKDTYILHEEISRVFKELQHMFQFSNMNIDQIYVSIGTGRFPDQAL